MNKKKSTTTNTIGKAATKTPVPTTTKQPVVEEKKKVTEVNKVAPAKLLGKRKEISQDFIPKKEEFNIKEESDEESDFSDEDDLGDINSDDNINENSDISSFNEIDINSEDEESEDEESEDEDRKEEEKELKDYQKKEGLAKRWTDDPDQFYDNDDSSEDESVVNRVGNIPLEWYDDYDHIGYDVNGNKIMKGEAKDSLDKFLDQTDPKFWRTVYDKVNDKNVVLTDEDMEFLKNIQQRKFPPGFNPYEQWYDPGPNPDSIHPISNAPVHKTSFYSYSKSEERTVVRMAHAIRMGWIKLDKKKEKKSEYDIWGEEEKKQEEEENEYIHTARIRAINRIPAPKQRLPGNVESFNPPEEYLLNSKELKAWRLMDRSERPHGFIPQKCNHLRLLPEYRYLIKERFERCLDLYLCPRVRKVKRYIKDSKSLLPELPKPQDLRPFPSSEALQYNGHTNRIRAISISPNGQWLASGSDDCTVKIWEVTSTRCIYSTKVDHEVQCLAWNPNPQLNILAVGIKNTILIITPPIYGTPEQNEETELILEKPQEKKANPAVKWYTIKESDKKTQGWRIEIQLPFTVKTLNWHYKGDYFSTTSPDEGNKSVKIHHLSKRATQAPFRKSKTPNQVTKFHPNKAIFFVADQNIVRVYDLLKQQIIKKLITGCKYISSIDIHPVGDNVIVGGYDKRVFWFDLDLSVRPYKVLNYHSQAVRKVVYHQHYPLFASCSDDLSIHIFHGMVYDDLMKNALIVPLKILKNHESVNGIGVLDIVFHPKQPWIFSSGADSTIRLYT